MDQWYIAIKGQQEGPLTTLQVKSRVVSGNLDPATVMVWQEGLPDWKPLSASGILVGVESTSPAAANPAVENPYHVSEQTRNSTGPSNLESAIEYPGYGRLRYIASAAVTTIILYVILIAIIYATMGGGKDLGPVAGIAALVIFLLIIASTIYFGVQRVENLGMSRWAILWTLVPFMNIWIGWRMLACPAGYEQHRTLDKAGKVLTGIWIGLFVLMIVLNIFAAVAQI